MIITLDGPGGSGKSTAARLLARALGFLYLDTGAMFRAVAYAAQKDGISLDDETGLRDLCARLDLCFRHNQDPPRLLLQGEDISEAIRTPEMDMMASKVSALGTVRKAMVQLQREMAQQANVIAEGRDMGTVVFPKARHKFFLTASPQVRAGRRYLERMARGEVVSRDTVEADLRRRDLQDETRALAPLIPAQDAVVIDTTSLSIQEVLRGLRSCFDEDMAGQDSTK